MQEALTNARKHAPGEAVSVRLDGAPSERLTIEVRNDLPAVPAAGPGQGGGQGLIGLAERARLAGGELGAAPVEGGFLVSAWLPWPVADDVLVEGGAEGGAGVAAPGSRQVWHPTAVRDE